MATYVVGDIHNSLIKLNGVLKQISLSYKDNLILLGDLFDRGAAEPDPVGVYFRICGLDARVTWIRGNHDQLLADYIYQYYGLPEKKKGSLRSYRYNSFDLMNKRLTEADMLNIADQIMKLPLQAEMEIDGVKYIYLSNENDIASFCIRKMNTINGNEYLVGLNDRNEFNMALEKFLERHQND